MSARPDFGRMTAALKENGICWPLILVDQVTLERNIDRLKRVAGNRNVRIVVKSLPCQSLLQLAGERLGTDRFMTFNLAMLEAAAHHFPDNSQLLGKPLPVAAAKQFESRFGGSMNKVIWLLDSVARIDAYAQFAQQSGTRLKVALEVDIGLHRGGFEPGPALIEALKAVHEAANLQLAGLMGYEAHVAALPATFGWRERELRRCLDKLAVAKRQVAEIFGPDIAASIIINSGGSKTVSLHGEGSVANELSAGSILLKPTDFDHDLTGDFEPAAFIAAPVLKGPLPTRVPGMGFADALHNRLFRKSSNCIYIHGGHWMAEPVHPDGLRHHRLVGQSSNQEMLTGGPNLPVKPGDFVYFRPHQSEAVLMQFGDLAVFDGEKISQLWPVFPPSA